VAPCLVLVARFDGIDMLGSLSFRDHEARTGGLVRNRACLAV
jgi:hypothetical protein